VFTDLCVLEPDDHRELTAVALYPGVSREAVAGECGWPLRFSDAIREMAPPSHDELRVLRDLQERTARAHGSDR
jgi:glutaconate CoA-transferase subunit B